jgi:hypothetical protein
MGAASTRRRPLEDGVELVDLLFILVEAPRVHQRVAPRGHLDPIVHVHGAELAVRECKPAYVG